MSLSLLTLLMSGMRLMIKLLISILKPCYALQVKTEAIPAPSSSYPGEDSFDIRFGDEFESRHPLTQASKEDNLTSGK